MEMLGKKLTKEEFLALDIKKNEQFFALHIFDLEGDVYLVDETKGGYDFNFVLNPKALSAEVKK